jgi:hypothetical protein
MRSFVIRSPAQHGFKKARCLDDLKITLDEFAVLDIYDNVAVSLNAGQMVYVHIYIGHGYLLSFGSFRTRLRYGRDHRR